jgi:hypothetical protein
MFNKIELSEEFKNSVFPNFSVKNLPIVPAPEDADVKYPEDLTQVDGSGIGVLYGKFMGWAGYLKYLLNLSESKVLYLKSVIATYSAVTEKELRESGEKPGKIKLLISADQDLAMLETYLAELQFESKSIEARFEYFDTCSKAISRELSRRISEKEKTSPY